MQGVRVHALPRLGVLDSESACQRLYDMIDIVARGEDMPRVYRCIVLAMRAAPYATFH